MVSLPPAALIRRVRATITGRHPCLLLCCEPARRAGTRGDGLSSRVRPRSRVRCIHLASARERRHAIVSAINCKGNSAATAFGTVSRLSMCQSTTVRGARWRACAGRARRGVGLRVYNTLAAHANANAATAGLPPAGQSLRACIAAALGGDNRGTQLFLIEKVNLFLRASSVRPDFCLRCPQFSSRPR